MEEVRAYKVGEQIFTNRETALASVLTNTLAEIFAGMDNYTIQRRLVSDMKTRRAVMKALEDFEREVYGNEKA